MTFESFKEACFKSALEKGCEAAEVFFREDESFSVNVLNSEISKYTSAHACGLNLRVVFGGKTGYAYTEVFKNADALVESAIDNARVIESNDENPMQGKCEYPTISQKQNPVADMSESKKIELALKLERDTLDFDDRVNRVACCAVETGVETIRIHNTCGLCADKENKYSAAVIEPILRIGEDERESFAFKFGSGMLDCGDIIKESVDNALMQFHASAVDSGEYRVLLRSDAATDLLSAFSGMFSADSVQKGLSLLKDKLGERIANSCISIIDDPFEEDNPRAFDAEGTPSVKTVVVEDGMLKSFLHNLKTARKAGVASTSNAGRAGVASPVGVSPSNFFIAKGEKSFDTLVSELDSGIVVTELGGLHSGLDPVSGDFSLIAKGLLVEQGSVIRSVDQITCAGNFLSLMNSVIAAGSDLRFGFPGGGRVGSPSLLVEKLMISGK